ncbi:MAG: hypothetical protein ABH828_06470 [archaeon]
MNSAIIYLLVSIAALVIIFYLLLLLRYSKKDVSFTPFLGVGLALTIFGGSFSDKPLLGYGMLTLGLIIAVIDTKKRLKEE